MKRNTKLILSRQRALISHRQFVTGVAAGSALYGLGMSATPSAAKVSAAPAVRTLRGNRFDLDIGYKAVMTLVRGVDLESIDPGPLYQARTVEGMSTLRTNNRYVTHEPFEYHHHKVRTK